VKGALWVFQNFGVWHGVVYVIDTAANKVRRVFERDSHKYWDPNHFDLSERVIQHQEEMQKLRAAMLDNKGRPRIVHVFDTEN
jgi:hypothetical protein